MGSANSTHQETEAGLFYLLLFKVRGINLLRGINKLGQKNSMILQGSVALFTGALIKTRKEY